MAALIGKISSDGGRTEAHRLAHKRLDVQAATWRTFADVMLFPDGSGGIEVRQDDQVIHRFEWGPEGQQQPGERAA
jgi:hypothetical protein